MDEIHRTRLVAALGQLAGKKFPKERRDALLEGAGERDLVNAGLEPTMIHAHDEIREGLDRRRGVNDLRTAAYISAISNVGQSYLELGIFP